MNHPKKKLRLIKGRISPTLTNMSLSVGSFIYKLKIILLGNFNVIPSCVRA